MNEVDIQSLREWIGQQDVQCDVITQAPVAGLSSTLDYPAALAAHGEPLPQPWHWLYFLPSALTAEIDTDGHPRRGGFLPPVPLPRRMWAGSSIRFVSDLLIGDAVRRESTIADVLHKRGGSGELVFVKLRHEIFAGDRLAVEEEQDLVYRAPSIGSTPPRAAPAPAVPTWSRTIKPDPVLLFRYSALTFNAHRIHYDRDYARDEEGYAGLVVQGPLVATLLLDLLRREVPQARVATFSFRGLRALLDTGPFRVQGAREGDSVKLWALNDPGALAMDAQATLA